MFPCTQCGLCCRCVGLTIWGKHMALPNLACKWLDEESNLCTIYEKRPLMCNVDAFYEKVFSTGMTREEFYTENKAVCEELRKLTEQLE